MPVDIPVVLEKCLPLLLNTSQPMSTYGQSVHSSHRIPVVRHLMIGLCTMFSLTGATFNLLLIFALLKFRRTTLRNNITNLFVLCLAVSDIFLCSVSMPVQMFYEINEHQLANTGLCRVLFAGFGLPLNISCLTILLIAFDRYRMIVHPLKMQMSTRVATSLIGFVVLFGAINSIPVALHVDSSHLTDFAYCVERWPDPRLRLAYSVSVFLICFVLPLAASGAFYLAIYCRVSKQSMQLGFRKEAERRKRRTTSLLVVTVVCFVLCWTPWCLYSLLLEIQSMLTSMASIQREPDPPQTGGSDHLTISPETCGKIVQDLTEQQIKELLLHVGGLNEANRQKALLNIEIIPGRHIKLIDLLCKMIAMGSACVNPFIYGWLNEPIQKVMRRQYGRLTSLLNPTSGLHEDHSQMTVQTEHYTVAAVQRAKIDNSKPISTDTTPNGKGLNDEQPVEKPLLPSPELTPGVQQS